ncbi:predicted protein [Arabidopsis lyrata subsp. lyrata]|uniref:Predicted protein n=1 Tax=Arabidopsis lyrata subsp. lyrata TaxID=81972 RepID=D7LMT9_ARALL|nr:predicted protein [Arabidopsis lyrata subsp. lyrata]
MHDHRQPFPMKLPSSDDISDEASSSDLHFRRGFIDLIFNQLLNRSLSPEISNFFIFFFTNFVDKIRRVLLFNGVLLHHCCLLLFNGVQFVN